MSGAASVVGKVNNNVFVGSGIYSDSCGVCGCGCRFSVISWEECDTLSKKMGFIFGKVINCMINLVYKAYSLIFKTINILCFDKLFDLFSRIIRGGANKLYDVSVWIFKNCIKPIFINEITKKMCDIIKVVFNGVNDYLISPIYELIKKILPKPSCPIKHKVAEEKKDFKVVVIFNKFLHLINTGLKTICNWTIVPVFNWTVKPLFHVIGDIFVGMVSGVLPSQEDKKVIVESGD